MEDHTHQEFKKEFNKMMVELEKALFGELIVGKASVSEKSDDATSTQSLRRIYRD